MLMIRLQRIGAAKKPTYRFVISEKNKDTQAGSLEILGSYDPVQKQKQLTLNTERIKYWLSVAAQPSETVHNMFVKEGIIDARKKRVVRISDKRRAKLQKKAEAEKKATEQPAA
jgi:small subunit ribosomal protein S16